ncbi:MAG: cation transporter [Candidatus Thorarchaeota archaeon]
MTLTPKKVLIIYVLVSLTSSIIEIIFLRTFFYSFWITYIGVFFTGHYIRRGINDFFKQFHIKKVVRSLIIPWIMFFLIILYVQLYFLSDFIATGGGYLGFNYISIFIFFMGLIILVLVSINPLIRIVAVAFHRRKSSLFPINRVEYAAMKFLIGSPQNSLLFSELKNQIKGTFNIFIPNLYFDEKTSISSIYHLCGLRLADINDNIVKLNENGLKQEKIWSNTLKNQNSKFNKILTSSSVLIRSFIGLFILSLLKIFIGLFNSESLTAEGFENFLDCIAVVLIGIGIKYRKEKLVNIILISLMAFAGGSLLYSSIESLILGPKQISNTLIIIIIALISIFLNTYMRALKNFVGKKSRNSSLVASAIDSRVNIIISIGIIMGASFSDFGRAINAPLLYYLDPIIAIVICFFIFKEVIEIFREFITGKEEDIELGSFQMAYEENFKEYIVKWILTVFYHNDKKMFTSQQLDKLFQDSISKGDLIYTDLSNFGLYIFKEEGLASVINNLIDLGLLIQINSNNIKITEKGIYMYENLYSKPLLEDIKDPFDFFFEQKYDFDSIMNRKQELLDKYSIN